MSVQRISRTSRVPRPGIDWFNKVGQAVNDHEQRSKTFGPRAASPISKEPQALIVLVKNTTEDTIGQYRPLDLDGTVIHEQSIVLKGVVGAGGRCVITQEVIPAGKVGRAAISGVTFAQLNGAISAQAESNGTSLDLSGSGIRVIYSGTGSGERLGVVLLDETGAGSTEPLLIYSKLICEGGPTAVSFDWALTRTTDSVVMASGSYPTDSFAAMKSAMETAIGETVDIYSAGPFPQNEVEFHPNRADGADLYIFSISNESVTPVTDGWAYVKVALCRMPGG